MSAAWPVWLLSLATYIDRPFSLACDRADKAGRVLADVLLERVQGGRPVQLVGYSVGARTVMAALGVLYEKGEWGVVESVVLAGAAVTCDAETLRRARAVVAGRFVNVYQPSDLILQVVYRAANLVVSPIMGLAPVEADGVEDVNAADLGVDSHIMYAERMPALLEGLGF